MGEVRVLRNGICYSRFALPVFGNNEEIVRYNVFHVAMVFRHVEDGNKYL